MKIEKQAWWVGWELLQEPSKDDYLTVKKHGVSKCEMPATLVWKSMNPDPRTIQELIARYTSNIPVVIKHQFYSYDLRVLMDETVEFLLNDKPIPDWVKPIIE